MPSFPEPPSPFTNGSVELRLAAERDIPETLIAFQDDAELHERLGLERPPSGAELGRRAERAEEDRVKGRAVTLTILEPGSDVCLGQISTPHVEWEQERAELGMWVAPQARGRGLGAGALRLAALWLLAATSLERLQILTESHNEPMLRAARAAGFSDEGTLRGYTRERGRRVDCAVLSLIKGDLRP